jgi:LysM repeat protein
MYVKNIFTFALCLFALTASAQDDSRTRYIDDFKEIAILEMERTGIPASIKLAQGILESNAGQSELARRANNHFGIKCGGSWDGKSYYKKDDDYDDEGQLIESCFRKYRDAESSYIAHSEFLRDPKKQYRYGFLFRLDPTDYKKWAKGLKDAGYATSATYQHKLIDIIERYQLNRFDQMTSPEAIANEEAKEEGEDIVVVPGSIFENNDVRYVLAADDETLANISVRTGVKLSSLLEYNDDGYERNQPLAKGTVIYLQSKRKSFRGKRKWHYVKAEESMFSISQIYGIRLECLYDKNQMNKPQQPAVGERLKIRGGKLDKRPVLQSEVSTNTVDKDEDKPGTVRPDTDEDGNIIMDEDDTDTEADKPKDPLIPLPDLDDDKEEDTDKPVVKPPVVPKPDTTTTRPDTGFDEDELDTDEDTDTTPPASSEVFYTVVRGDTLYSISRRYNTSVDKIKQLNSLSSNVISIGQRLRVK